MNLKVYPNTKIYILCYPEFETGGIECLYMLCDKLLSFGFDAYLYFEKENKQPLRDYYNMYNVKYTFQVYDHPENILIVPEVTPFTVFDFNHIQKAIWWLSVDFYMGYCKLYNNLLDFSGPKSSQIINLSHSAYTTSFLIQEGASNIFKISDYLNKVYTNKTPVPDGRNNVVLYNPAKGFEYTKRLIAASPEIDFISIENMDRNKISELMHKSKLYIDFGFHPGQDRLPRESVASGCVILTNKMGSAFFFEDVPLTDEYKFQDFNIEQIKSKIVDIFDNFNLHYNKFERYRMVINNHEKALEAQIKYCFEKI